MKTFTELVIHKIPGHYPKNRSEFRRIDESNPNTRTWAWPVWILFHGFVIKYLVFFQVIRFTLIIKRWNYFSCYFCLISSKESIIIFTLFVRWLFKYFYISYLNYTKRIYWQYSFFLIWNALSNDMPHISVGLRRFSLI